MVAIAAPASTVRPDNQAVNIATKCAIDYAEVIALVLDDNTVGVPAKDAVHE